MELKASRGAARTLFSNEEVLSMDKQTKQLTILRQLHGLADQPGTQARYALELLDQERGNQVVSAALDIVTAAATSEARPVLLRLYDYYDAAGIKRDAGSYLRSAILGALLAIADPADWTLAEHATDRKSTRLNSSHVAISYAVFCLKKKRTRGRTMLSTNLYTTVTTVSG